MVLSPNHPNADADGELQVRSGDRLPGIPEHIFKLGSNYQLRDNLSIGADLIYNSDQVMRGDESNELDTIDGYALVNHRANYSLNSNFSLFAKVSNVFDTKYENFGLLGESPNEVLPSLADDRPLFFGVGAPRGTWLGLRYSF
jgi:iron complex outermembrane receptor protein